MKVLELFSGIGGMKYSLQAGEIEADVVAVEINTIANTVYKYNFPSSTLLQKNILSLKEEELKKIEPDMILMSPPCQPFTRVGLKKDLSDARSDPLKHILSILPDLMSLSYILVENVKGFENSEARSKLVSCLEDLSFELREFLITPTQVGVPNMRTRYYLLGKKKPLKFHFESSGIMEELPEEGKEILKTLENRLPKFEKVGDLLETDDVSSEVFKEHLIPSDLLQKRVWVMDIVTRDASRTCCFTKAYGYYLKGTGSVYCPYDQPKIDSVLKKENCQISSATSLRELMIRYFTPREVARFMCFPDSSFAFPPNIKRQQQYRLLGNSINVKVVTVLIKLLLIDAVT